VRYPDSITIRKVKNWPWSDFRGMIAFIHPLFGEMGTIRVGRKWIKFATGGWSGNEEIIGAMRANYGLWSLYWESSHRGGLHVFHAPGKDQMPR